MTLDRHAAERRRFARLLGTDGEAGCGLPIGEDSGQGSEPRSDTGGDAKRGGEDEHRHGSVRADEDTARSRGTSNSSAE
ncbi:hypothetical protein CHINAEXTREME_01840 [Halobiforma lacisalsi AJ5]|uniref:Uncharacterized protein n=1 Tax=Natronobacterium lacisalsi AJ5 TaxID=358396 RepID=M0LEW3_NATLA|nr:hypothetical protein [Halobiforma lacisalsi]APW96587.1 hypothetical protein CHINAEXTREME_01840 [Halobiforma lacisalsi AJ5]EMA32132.1 hypothetical protein C445_12496 [Halobiforma lacisalsi AJ5]